MSSINEEYFGVKQKIRTISVGVVAKERSKKQWKDDEKDWNRRNPAVEVITQDLIICESLCGNSKRVLRPSGNQMSTS